MAYYHYYYYYLFIIFYYCNYYYIRLIQLRSCITHAHQAKELQKKCCDLSLASNLPQFDLMAHGRLAKKKKSKIVIALGGLPELWKTLIGFVPVPFKIMSNIQLSLNKPTNQLNKQNTSLWFLIGWDYKLVILLVFSLFLRCLDLCSTHE